MVLNRLLSIGILSLIFYSSSAQILDDTTTLLYGPKTTSFFYERNIKLNIDDRYGIDTTLTSVHRVDWADRHNKEYQGLGNVGTALTPTFYTFPEVVGARPGYDAYNLYVRGPNEVKYFDTRSPYINLDIFFGGQGRSVTSFEFTRNVRENWNVGFNIRRLVSDKQIGAQQLRGDRNADQIYYDLYMSYKSDNGRYHALGYLSRFDHRVDETGGIRVFSDERAELFRYTDAIITLRTAVAKDFRFDYHAYHQYELTKYSQIYHSVRRNSQRNNFNDFSLASDTASFYPTPLIDPDSTKDRSRFLYLENEVGLKGNIGPLFYSGYLKRRDINHYYRYSQPFEKTSETYFGFNARFDFSEKVKLGGDGEFLQNGNFKGNAFIETPLLEGGYHVARYEPSNLQKSFLGNHAEWDNSFNSIFAFELYGNLKYSNKFIQVKPGFSLTTIDNYVYFDQNITPQQAGRAATMTSLKLDLDVKLPKHFNINTSTRFTNVSGDAADVFRIPELFSTGGIYYDNRWFNKYMQVRIGVDLHYRTAYFANSYDPITQQFYLQDGFELESYLLADAYLSTKVNNFMIILKFNHVNQSGDDGYFITPFYPGIPRVFDISFKWRFFD